MQTNLSSYLPKSWKLEYSESDDYPIGNDILFYLFQNLSDWTIEKYVQSTVKFDDDVPLCSKNEATKEKVLSDILSHVFQPAVDYDPQSYNYRVSRREVGKLVRNQVFSMLSGTIHLIGPELESLQNVVETLFTRKVKYIFYTIDETKKSNYQRELSYNKRTKLNLSHVLTPQRKNQNNFFKGLIYHLNNIGIPRSILYIGSFPSFWLEMIKWLPMNVICYDPKYRNVDNDKVIWREKYFTLDDVDFVDSNSYVYIDIRSDVRNMKEAQKEQAFRDEDNLNVELALALHKKNCTVVFKRKIFEGINETFNQPLFHPKLLQLGREYYNMISGKYDVYKYSQEEMFGMLIDSRSNNVANYVYGGMRFDSTTRIHENETVVALYSLSNASNSVTTIENVINANHFITFPMYRDFGDWRDIDEQHNDTPFPQQKKQLEFKDWAIDPKRYCLKYGNEVVSESVFLQLGQTRALIPDLYNHMITFKYRTPMFFSDRYFSHIGIRQPSVYKRDNYMTSRISAYISRQLTHSVQLTSLRKNKFEGYSGHLIAVELYFNSLVFTMSPLRWLIRAKNSMDKKVQRDRFRIGLGEPHTRSDFVNTYEYISVNNLTDITFKKLLLD